MMSRLLKLSFLLLALGACQDKGKVATENDLSSGGTPGAGDYLDSYVLPGSASLSAGRSVNFEVLGLLPYGNSRIITAFGEWQVSDPTMLEVVPNSVGRIRALAPGDSEVIFTYGNIVTRAKVSVSPKTLDQLKLSESSLSYDMENVGGVIVSKEISVVATGLYSDGSTADLSADVDWICPDPAIVACKGSGKFQVLSIGSTTVSAKVAFLEKAVTIDVGTHGRTFSNFTLSPSPMVLERETPQPLVLTAHFSNGETLDVSSLATFTLTNNALAIISGSSTKSITAKALGSGQINVSWDGHTDAFPLRVVDPLAITLTVESPTKNFDIANGETETFLSKITYSDGTVEDVTSLTTWTSSDLAILSPISGAVYAKFSAVGTGTATLKAKFGPITVNLPITVSIARLSSIAITSVDSGTLGLNLTRVFKARGYYSDNTNRDITNNAVWTVTSSGGAGSYDSPGVFHGTTQGNVTIRATHQGKTQTQALTIGPAVPVEIIIEPVPVTGSIFETSLAAGQVQLHAKVRYSDSPDQPESSRVYYDRTTSVTWTYTIVGDDLSFCGYVRDEAGYKGILVPLSTGYFKAVAKMGDVVSTRKVQVKP